MRPLDRITTWLCFAAALLMGVSPAQSFVLCLEPDGCVSLELPTSPGDDCSDCDEHVVEPGAPAAPVVVPEGTSCSCVDLPIPGVTKDSLVGAKRTDRTFVPSTSVQVALPVALRPTAEFGGLAPPSRSPRPPDSLPLIRSVVLLV